MAPCQDDGRNAEYIGCLDQQVQPRQQHSCFLISHYPVCTLDLKPIFLKLISKNQCHFSQHLGPTVFTKHAKTRVHSVLLRDRVACLFSFFMTARQCMWDLFKINYSAHSHEWWNISASAEVLLMLFGYQLHKAIGS